VGVIFILAPEKIDRLLQGERAHAHMTQQINIKLIAADEWKKALIEPALGAPDVYIAAPTPLADVKHVLHKLAPHGDHIELAINMSHTLQMAVEDDVTGTITAVWRGMEHPSYIGDKLQKQQPPPPSSDEDEADENDGGNRGGAAPSKAMAVFDLEDADATENATFTRVYVNKSVLNKLLGSTEMFSEGGKARVIL
jgi:hypothetical protein